MSFSGRVDADFMSYLESLVNLDALDRVTEDLGEELKDSQKVMNEIKDMIEAIPKKAQDLKPGPNFSGPQHADAANFLDAGPPNLLMPDMVETASDVDLDSVLAMMKNYTEDIIKNTGETDVVTPLFHVKRELTDLQLEQYASGLKSLCKRLNSIKLGPKDEGVRDHLLESKLSVLCDDVNMLAQTVQAKASLGEANKNWTPAEQQRDALKYDQIINKLLTSINEVSYLFNSKK